MLNSHTAAKRSLCTKRRKHIFKGMSKILCTHMPNESGLKLTYYSKEIDFK